MTTEVTPTDIRVWFGWVPIYRRVLPVGDVRRIGPAAFRPIADYGFWGVRSGRDGERALIARGHRGVRLELADGSILIIGSQRPDELAMAIKKRDAPLDLTPPRRPVAGGEKWSETNILLDTCRGVR